MRHDSLIVLAVMLAGLVIGKASWAQETGPSPEEEAIQAEEESQEWVEQREYREMIAPLAEAPPIMTDLPASERADFAPGTPYVREAPVAADLGRLRRTPGAHGVPALRERLTDTGTLVDGGMARLTAQDSPLREGERILFIGDSITRRGTRYGSGYIHQIGDGIAEAFPGANITLFNGGITGAKVAYFNNNFDRLVTAYNPTVVFICPGMTDAWQAEVDLGTPPDVYGETLMELIEQVRAIGATPVLATPTVWGERREGQNRFDDLMQAYQKVAHRVAEETDTTLCPMRQVMISDETRDNRLDSPANVLTYDGVHPNLYGNIQIAELAAGAIADALLQRGMPEEADVAPPGVAPSPTGSSPSDLPIQRVPTRILLPGKYRPLDTTPGVRRPGNVTTEPVGAQSPAPDVTSRPRGASPLHTFRGDGDPRISRSRVIDVMPAGTGPGGREPVTEPIPSGSEARPSGSPAPRIIEVRPR